MDKSILITGIVIDEKSKSASRYKDTVCHVYDVVCFTGLDFKTLEDVDISIDSVYDIVINPPTLGSTSYKIAINNMNIPYELLCSNMAFSDTLNVKLCHLFGTNRNKIYKSSNRITIPISLGISAYFYLDTKSIEIATGCYYPEPMFVNISYKPLTTLVKSIFLSNISNGMYEYGDTCAITDTCVSTNIVIPKSTKKLVIDKFNDRITSVVFNKVFDKINSDWDSKIKLRRIAISKETSHKQLAMITKFIMNCKKINDKEFDRYFKYEMYSTCYNILKDSKGLSDYIYDGIEIIVY